MMPCCINRKMGGWVNEYCVLCKRYGVVYTIALMLRIEQRECYGKEMYLW